MIRRPVVLLFIVATYDSGEKVRSSVNLLFQVADPSIVINDLRSFGITTAPLNDASIPVEPPNIFPPLVIYQNG